MINNFMVGTHQFLGGKETSQPGFTGKETVEFPSPIGKCEVMFCDHPETLTLPRIIKGVKNVTVKGGLFPSAIHNVMECLSVKYCGGPVLPLDTIVSSIENLSKNKNTTSASATRIDVRGQKNGEEIWHIHNMIGGTAAGTALGLALGVFLLARSEVKIKGAFPPEALEPELFLNELKRTRGLNYRQYGSVFSFSRKPRTLLQENEPLC
jgi:saccharopine dehydrogenase-like NADP-dependent oxidoreductase